MGVCIRCGKETENSYLLRVLSKTEQNSENHGRNNPSGEEDTSAPGHEEYACTRCLLASQLQLYNVVIILLLLAAAIVTVIVYLILVPDRYYVAFAASAGGAWVAAGGLAFMTWYWSRRTVIEGMNKDQRIDTSKLQVIARRRPIQNLLKEEIMKKYPGSMTDNDSLVISHFSET